MKNLLKKSVYVIMVVMSLSGTVLASSGWHPANGGSYTLANSYASSAYDGITIKIKKIAKDGKQTDYSGYKKAKVKVHAGNSKAYWVHSSGSADSVEEKQNAYRTCTKGTLYTFLLVDSNGNPGMRSSISTYYKGNNSALNAEVYSVETVY